MLIPKLIVLVGLVCSAMLLGIYLNAGEPVVVTHEKIAFAIVMGVVSASVLISMRD